MQPETEPGAAMIGDHLCPSPSQLPRLSRRRRIAFIMVTLATAAALQELLFRLVFPVPELANFNRIDYTPVLHFADAISEPLFSGLSNVRIRLESEPDGFAFEHTLNLYGFRGPDFAVEPDELRPRVLFVGDSFTEGFGAADSATIPEQFGRLLAGEPRPPEPINLGVAAAGFSEYAQLIRDCGELLQPQAIFLVICWNDLPAIPFSRADKLPPRTLVRHSPYVPRAAQVLGRLAAGRAAPRRWHAGPFPFFAAAPSSHNPMADTAPRPNIDPAVLDAMRRGTANPWSGDPGTIYERFLHHEFTDEDGAREALTRIASLCRERHCPLTVVYIPYLCVTNPAYLAGQHRLGGPDMETLAALARRPDRQQQQHLDQVCRDLGIPFLDTTGALIEAEKEGNRLFWPVDSHCNAAGYALVAKICAQHSSTCVRPRAAERGK
jgi:lysophospholipase L1-like esterase